MSQPIDQLERDALLETARKLMVESQALSTRIAVLNEIATAINETLELTQILRVVQKKAKWLLDFAHCSVAMQQQGVWVLHHIVGEPLGEATAVFAPTHPIGQTNHTGRPNRHGTPHPAVAYPAFLAVPIKLGNQTIGSLNFGATTPYSQDDVRIAYMLCQQIAAAFRNTLQFEELTRTYDELRHEQKKSETLLHNILPRAVAEELKQRGEVVPIHYPVASVLFTDFRGFTAVAQQTEPAILVRQLNWYFTRFDAICEKHGVEKLKTIGDAYMCVSGVPTPHPDHALRLVRTGLDILKILEEPDAPGWVARVGIHSGELVAGVIGQHKFSFDVWGDTVNIAARVESHGVPGQVTLTAATWRLIQHEITCQKGEMVTLRNIGDIQLYYVAP